MKMSNAGTRYTSTTEQQCSKAVNILKLLWKRFNRQTLANKFITLLVMMVTSLVLILFYSSFVMWQIFSFIIAKGILGALEWYLIKVER